jgi:hypothetical protein
VLDDADPLAHRTGESHRLSLAEARQGSETFQKDEDGAIKVVLRP